MGGGGEDERISRSHSIEATIKVGIGNREQVASSPEGTYLNIHATSNSQLAETAAITRHVKQVRMTELHDDVNAGVLVHALHVDDGRMSDLSVRSSSALSQSCRRKEGMRPWDMPE